MDCVTFPKRSRVRPNGSSTVGRRLRRSTTGRTIASAYNIGREKGLQVSGMLFEKFARQRNLFSSFTVGL